MKTLSVRFLFTVRFLLSIVVFGGLAVQYSQRISFKVMIECMVNQTALDPHTNWFDHVDDTSLIFNRTKIAFGNLSLNVCGYKNNVVNRSHLDGPFVWTKSDQRLILTSYAIGYSISQIPGGYLAFEIGAKRVILIAYLVASVLIVLTPILANLGKIPLIICRFFVGIFHGVIWPTFASLWASWVPVSERGRLIGLAYSGSQMGNAITLPLGRVFCNNGFYGSWPTIFIVIGLTGLAWLLIWLLLSSDSPEKSPYVGKFEKEYLLAQIPEQFSVYERLYIPWKEIFTCKSCLALFVGHTCSKLGTYLLIESLPLYIREILELDEISDGVLFAIPYLFFWFFTIVSGIISDQLVFESKISRTSMRKVFHVLSFFVPMLAMIGLVFVNCNLKILAIALITVCLAFTGCAYGAGLFISYHDISGPFASITFGIGNTFGSLSGIIAPFIVELMQQNKTKDDWYIEYTFLAVMYFFGGVVLLRYSSSKKQEWAIKRAAREKINLSFSNQLSDISDRALLYPQRRNQVNELQERTKL